MTEITIRELPEENHYAITFDYLGEYIHVETEAAFEPENMTIQKLILMSKKVRNAINKKQ